jgi:hypothetical protein
MNIASLQRVLVSRDRDPGLAKEYTCSLTTQSSPGCSPDARVERGWHGDTPESRRGHERGERAG